MSGRGLDFIDPEVYIRKISLYFRIWILSILKYIIAFMAMPESRFFVDNPPTREGAKMLYVEKQHRENLSGPLEYLAERMWEGSRMGLMITSGQLEKGLSDEPTLDFGNTVLRHCQYDASCLVFSSIFPGLLEAEQTGFFPARFVMERIKMGFVGTSIPPMKFDPADASERLDLKTLELLKASRKKNETLANVFVNRSALPDSVRRFIILNHDTDHFPLMLLLIQVAQEWDPLANTYLEIEGQKISDQGHMLSQSVTEILPADGGRLNWRQAKSQGNLTNKDLERLEVLKQRINPGQD